jgi:hypothetical protein
MCSNRSTVDLFRRRGQPPAATFRIDSNALLISGTICAPVRTPRSTLEQASIWLSTSEMRPRCLPHSHDQFLRPFTMIGLNGTR